MSSQEIRPGIGRVGHEVDDGYVWDRPPTTYLAPRQVARLMIFRSFLHNRHLLCRRAPASQHDERHLPGE
jgi:hypothetical protein